MTKSTHTPGPWAAAAAPSGIVGWPVVGPNGRMICDVSIINRCGNAPLDQFSAYYDECEANARLIAASPTMFDYIARRAAAGDSDAAAILEKIHATR